MEEGLFNFGKKKTKKQQVVHQQGSHFVMPNGSVIKNVNLSLDQLNDIDWVNDFPWMIISKFNARYLDISPVAKQVFKFEGDWTEGHFVGGDFTGTFNGKSFEGNFNSNYTDWKANPFAFVDGKVAQTDQGIFGLKKLNPTVFDSSSPEKSFSLLQIPAGYYVNITDSNGYLHSFKVVKTMDSTSNLFSLELQTGSKSKVNLLWSDLRSLSEGEFLKNTTITVGARPQIPKLFDREMMGKIVSVEVSPKGSVGNSQKLFKFNTSSLGNGIRPQVVTLFFDTNEEVTKFQKIQDEIEAGWFKYHLKNIVNGLKFNAIDGYGKNIYLTDIFAQTVGTKKPNKKMQESLNWLEEFVRVVVLNIVKAKKSGGQYVDSPTIQRSILNPIAIAVQTYLGNTQPQPPKPRKKKKAKKKPTAMIKENIRDIVLDQIKQQK